MTTADRPEVDDPRVLALAKARQQIAYESPFNAVCPPWDGLTEGEQQSSLLDARSYLHAALNAGLAAPVSSAVAAPAPDPTTPSRRAGLREALRRAVCEAEGFVWDSDLLEPDEYGDHADTVLAVLYREWPWLRAEAEDAAVPPADSGRADVEAPLSPDFEHPACGFHWHGRDGMDIPMRDGQPVCPRCELLRVEKLLAHRERRCEELRAESKRRGKIKLEQAEQIRQLESQLDEVRTQLGAETLRVGQAEADLRRMGAEPAAVSASPHEADTGSEVQQSEPQPDTPRCANCTHPKGDHSDRKDHKPSRIVPRRPWCHACDATCDYDEPAAGLPAGGTPHGEA